ncbi:MAG: hypothetical protein KDC79_02375 [Cyclobacteriaceae bacterium]|nr:hypothetical protein [Cyclobacteriaceae bacterium]
MKTEEMDFIKQKLTDASYELPYNTLEEIFEIEKLSDELLEFILDLKDNLIIIEFLNGYQYFSQSQLDRIEGFIENNLTNNDKLFVSELIAVANKWNITSIYDSCMSFINNEEEDSLVILESIYMIVEHIDLDIIEEVFDSLNHIINSKLYYQNCQLVAAFYLLRLSGHEKYFNDVVDYVENGQALNKDILANLLGIEYNQGRYFSYYDQLITLTK